MRIVYSYYCLDIVHSGHLLQMKNAKAVAGKDGMSIAGILSDSAVMEKKPRPTLSLADRIAVAEAIKYVDLVVPQNEYKPFVNVRNLNANVLFECATHDKKDLEEAKKVMKSLGGTVIITPYFPEQSSSGIKSRIRNKNGKS